MADDTPIFIDLDRPIGMLDPVRIHDGDLLVFHVDHTSWTPQEIHSWHSSVSAVLKQIKAAGAESVQAIILHANLSLRVIHEDQMREFGWVRAPGHPVTDDGLRDDDQTASTVGR